jgi:hypothetical protein
MGNYNWWLWGKEMKDQIHTQIINALWEEHHESKDDKKKMELRNDIFDLIKARYEYKLKEIERIYGSPSRLC